MFAMVDREHREDADHDDTTTVCAFATTCDPRMFSLAMTSTTSTAKTFVQPSPPATPRWRSCRTTRRPCRSRWRWRTAATTRSRRRRGRRRTPRTTYSSNPRRRDTGPELAKSTPAGWRRLPRSGTRPTRRPRPPSPAAAKQREDPSPHHGSYPDEGRLAHGDMTCGGPGPGGAVPHRPSSISAPLHPGDARRRKRTTTPLPGDGSRTPS